MTADTPDRSELRRRHVPARVYPNDPVLVGEECVTDEQPWPCDTAILLDDLDSRDARIASLEAALRDLRADVMGMYAPQNGLLPRYKVLALIDEARAALGGSDDA